MINVNSPTVQSMLASTPVGFGNMASAAYTAPPIQSDMQMQNDMNLGVGNQIPFGGYEQPQYPQQYQYQTLYQPMYPQQQYGMQYPQYPQYQNGSSIVGGYNPNVNAVFNGYSNPYMSNGFDGFGYQPQVPMDQDAIERLQMAEMNGLTYDEQLIQESNLYKSLSRIVSKSLGRSEEDAKRFENLFSIYNKYERKEEEEIKKKKSLSIHIKVTRGDEVLVDSRTDAVPVPPNGNLRNIQFMEMMHERKEAINKAKINGLNQMYAQAPERMYDNMDVVDFFNNGAGVLMGNVLSREAAMQRVKRVSQLYNKDQFRERLFKNNNIKGKAQITAIDRFVGRYGVMPDGRPVSPGHDPAVATSFSYDPKTGQYSVTAPNFIKDRLENARNSFISTIENNGNSL